MDKSKRKSGDINTWYECGEWFSHRCREWLDDKYTSVSYSLMYLCQKKACRKEEFEYTIYTFVL
jgi:hypothetical protein